MSLILYITLICGHRCLVRISDRYLHYLRKSKMLTILKNAPCFIMAYWLPWIHMMRYFDQCIVLQGTYNVV